LIITRKEFIFIFNEQREKLIVQRIGLGKRRDENNAKICGINDPGESNCG